MTPPQRWPRLWRWRYAAVCAAAAALPLAARAQAESSAPTVADWDTLETVAGRVYRGLVEAEDDQGCDFLEIRRPPGKPMFGVVVRVPRPEITRLERADPSQRQAVERLAHELRGRARIEAGRLESVVLVAEPADSAWRWRYAGRWFDLESNADEPLTRQAVVRIEQAFAACRLLLPPRTAPEQGLRVALFGGTQRYRAFSQDLGLETQHPAWFAPDRNLIAAGTDLARVAAEVAEIAAHHEALRVEIEGLRDALARRLTEERDRLQAEGHTRDEIRQLAVVTQRKFEIEIAQREKTLDRYDRQNAQTVKRATAAMHQALRHEVLHAWLENYVWPRSTHDVPVWLNEGLAQIFEHAVLEADSLRIDAPAAEPLARLQAELRGPVPLGLAELLTADGRSFLVLHGGGEAVSQRHYAAAWGLAWHMAFHRRLLDSPELKTYVAANAAAEPAQERFERLVAQPLEQFEREWRDEMLSLKAPRAGR